MFENPTLFRQARTMLEVPRREVAEVAGEKESSVVDVEAGRKKLRPELAYRLWAALWQIVVRKKQRFTEDQIERNGTLLDMMMAAHDGLASNVAPPSLLALFKGEGELSPEEERRFQSYRERTGFMQQPVPVPPLTFEQAGKMSVDQVMDAVSKEMSFNLIRLTSLLGKSNEQVTADMAEQLKSDPRVKFAAAQEWIAHLEKECAELRQKIFEANKELLEAYRRIVALEKELKAGSNQD